MKGRKVWEPCKHDNSRKWSFNETPTWYSMCTRCSLLTMVRTWKTLVCLCSHFQCGKVSVSLLAFWLNRLSAFSIIYIQKGANITKIDHNNWSSSGISGSCVKEQAGTVVCKHSLQPSTWHFQNFISTVLFPTGKRTYIPQQDNLQS